jgi:protein phosphatase
VLTRALGVYPDVDADLLLVEPKAGDRYLLCSDGLIREVTDNQVAATLRRLADPGEAARELVAQAKEHGGNDNITVVVVDVIDGAAADQADAAAAVIPDAGAETPAVLAGDEPVSEAIPATTEPPAPPRPTRQERREQRQERREQRQAAKAARRPRMRIVTVRVVAFFVLIAVILAGAYAGTDWYAHNTYYVGLDGKEINIYKGRPGGMLWWHPVLVDSTGVTTQDILADSVPALQGNVLETTLAAAKQYVDNLKQQKIADTPSISSVPTTTSTSKTTVPRSSSTKKRSTAKSSSTTVAR